MSPKTGSPDTLRARWSKREEDWLFSYPRSCDGHLLYGAWSGRIGWPELLRELEARGYDMLSLRFTITLKDAPVSLPAAGPLEDPEPEG